MPGFITDEEIAVLNLKYRNEAMEVALHSADPTDTASLVNEIAVTRAAVTFSDPATAIPISNIAVLEFADMPDDGTDIDNPGQDVTHISVHRVSDGGMVSSGAMSSTVRVPEGEIARIPIGSLEIDLE